MEYLIGEFSQVVRLSAKTLRYYDEEGLLKPTRTDALTGYRYYGAAAAERAAAVRELRALGFSVPEVREILAHCGEDEEIVPYLKRRSAEIARLITDYRATERRIRQFVAYQEELLAMKLNRDIVIKDLPEIAIASIRYRGRYDEVGKYFGPLAKAAGRWTAGAPFCLYHEAEYSETAADIELAVPVRRPVEGGGVTSRRLPGGRAATLVHQGPYDTIGDSYQKLYDYLKSVQAKTLLPSREVYLKGPGMFLAGNPKKYLTELQILLE